MAGICCTQQASRLQTFFGYQKTGLRFPPSSSWPRGWRSGQTVKEGPGHKKLWSWWPSGQARDSSWTLPLDPFFTPRQPTNFLFIFRFNSIEFSSSELASMVCVYLHGVKFPAKNLHSMDLCIWRNARSWENIQMPCQKWFNVQWSALTNVKLSFMLRMQRFVTHPVGRTWWAGHFPATTLNSKSSKSKEKWIIQSIWPFLVCALLLES